jgi:hypothetical protein
MSQSRLARLSTVSRFKICLFELGDGELTTEEQGRIRVALRAEAERLQDIASHIDLGESQPEGLPEPVRSQSGGRPVGAV